MERQSLAIRSSNGWDPLDELIPLRQALTRLIEPTLVRSKLVESEGSWSPLVKVVETKSDYLIRVLLPGMDARAIDICVLDNVVTIEGEWSPDQKEGERVAWCELPYGKYSRSLALPSTVNAEAGEARLKQGVLLLTLPKARASASKRIAIAPASELHTNGVSPAPNGQRELVRV